MTSLARMSVADIASLAYTVPSPLPVSDLNQDPWDLRVDGVVALFIGPQSIIAPILCPEPTKLSASIRKEDISGQVLLTRMNHRILRDVLDLQTFGKRVIVMNLVIQLRSQSAKYQVFKNAMVAGLSSKSRRVTRRGAVFHRIADEALSGENFLPSLHPSPPPPPPHVRRNEIEVGDSQGRKRRRLELNCSISSVEKPEPRKEFITSQSTDWDWLLAKWKPNGEEDQGLPVFGDSEYGSVTSRELNKERESGKKKSSKENRVYMSEEAISATIEEAITEMINDWRLKGLLLLEPRARSIWKQSRQQNDVQLQLDRFAAEIEHLERRRGNLKSEIAGQKWLTKTTLKNQCQCLDVTIEELEVVKWMVTLLQQPNPPKEIQPSENRQLGSIVNLEESLEDYEASEESLDDESVSTSSTDDDLDIESDGPIASLSNIVDLTENLSDSSEEQASLMQGKQDKPEFGFLDIDFIFADIVDMTELSDSDKLLKAPEAKDKEHIPEPTELYLAEPITVPRPDSVEASCLGSTEIFNLAPTEVPRPQSTNTSRPWSIETPRSWSVKVSHPGPTQASSPWSIETSQPRLSEAPRLEGLNIKRRLGLSTKYFGESIGKCLAGSSREHLANSAEGHLGNSIGEHPAESTEAKPRSSSVTKEITQPTEMESKVLPAKTSASFLADPFADERTRRRVLFGEFVYPELHEVDKIHDLECGRVESSRNKGLLLTWIMSHTPNEQRLEIIRHVRSKALHVIKNEVWLCLVSLRRHPNRLYAIEGISNSQLECVMRLSAWYVSYSQCSRFYAPTGLPEICIKIALEDPHDFEDFYKLLKEQLELFPQPDDHHQNLSRGPQVGKPKMLGQMKRQLLTEHKKRIRLQGPEKRASFEEPQA